MSARPHRAAVSPRSRARYRALGLAALLVLPPLLLPAWASDPPGASMADATLVAWWPLDGNAQDQGPHAMHGDVQAALPTADRFQRPASALQFNGAASVQVPHAPVQSQSGGLSLTMWVKADSFPGAGSRMLLGKSNYATATNYLLRLRPGGNLQWEYQDYTETSSGPLQAGQWHHLAVTAEGPALGKRIFVDGEEVPTFTPPGTAFGEVSAPITFGWASYGTEYFVGALDEIRIHARALGAEEIRQLMRQDAALFANGFEPVIDTDR
jgi:hypothetical protein